MSKQKIKLEPENMRTFGPGSFFVVYKFNGGIATTGGVLTEIKKVLDRDVGKGKYSLHHE